MSKPEIVPQKIVERKTLILNHRLDYCSVRSRGEALKKKFFARHGFVKPRFEDISLVTLSKYYEPYFVIGGKYSIDYYERHVYDFKVNDQTRKIHFGKEAFKSQTLPSQFSRIIKIAGEEHAHYENETYIILDRMLKEVSPEKFPLAPFESKVENSAEPDLDLRKAKISLESAIALLRCRLVKRPPDAAEVIKENFEINQRLVVYRPIYELAFQNTKKGETATALIDGITGEVISEKFSNGVSGKLVKYFNKTCSFNPPPAEKQSKAEAKSLQPQIIKIPETSTKIIQDTRKNCLLENRAPYLKVKFTLGCISLVVGLFAANFALFGWSDLTSSSYLLGEYARYACAYGGFGAIIFGSMLINDFFVPKSHKFRSPASTTSLKMVESDNEHLHFAISEFEEEKEADSQLSTKQKP